MSRAQPKDVKHAPSATKPENDSPGKVVVDSRGHSVWQWAKDVLENTSVLLKRLENKDLELEPTRKVPVLTNGRPGEKGTKPAHSNAKAAKETASKSSSWHPAMQPDDAGDRGGGFDPYNSR